MTMELSGTDLEPRRVFCIGLNYRDHVREMGSRMPEEPVVFMKPRESLLPAGASIPAPAPERELHYEAEMVVLLGDEVGPGSGWGGVAGVTLGLDLTLRDVQRELKSRGLPWERAKAFEASAPLGGFVDPERLEAPDALDFELLVDGEVRQRGDTRDLVFAVPTLIDALCRVWSLRAGDLIFTGTPSGVGRLREGARIRLHGSGLGPFSWTVRSNPR